MGCDAPQHVGSSQVKDLNPGLLHRPAQMLSLREACPDPASGRAPSAASVFSLASQPVDWHLPFVSGAIRSLRRWSDSIQGIPPPGKEESTDDQRWTLRKYDGKLINV
ncbi:hypothetical protein JEQ12_014020 [Ovis aries]|uniref:Uncharacterized protein n=1 Tax=Ovis aries TaxID=9940 RepID=A0A836AKE4_SHEEP|nr:hypothetical protein JEQ12_014020 [Ovis aries]